MSGSELTDSRRQRVKPRECAFCAEKEKARVLCAGLFSRRDFAGLQWAVSDFATARAAGRRLD